MSWAYFGTAWSSTNFWYFIFEKWDTFSEYFSIIQIMQLNSINIIIIYKSNWKSWVVSTGILWTNNTKISTGDNEWSLTNNIIHNFLNNPPPKKINRNQWSLVRSRSQLTLLNCFLVNKSISSIYLVNKSISYLKSLIGAENSTYKLN